MPDRLDESQLSSALMALNAELDSPWIIRNGTLHKQFEFESFITAFGVITQVALLAQRLNHHPDWTNRYKVVEFSLHTHKCAGISELDFQLAHAIEQLVDQ